MDPGGQMDSQGAIVADPNYEDVLYIGGDRKGGTNTILGIPNPSDGNLFTGYYEAGLGQTLPQAIERGAQGLFRTGRA